MARKGGPCPSPSAGWGASPLSWSAWWVGVGVGGKCCVILVSKSGLWSPREVLLNIWPGVDPGWVAPEASQFGEKSTKWQMWKLGAKVKIYLEWVQKSQRITQNTTTLLKSHSVSWSLNMFYYGLNTPHTVLFLLCGFLGEGEGRVLQTHPLLLLLKTIL